MIYRASQEISITAWECGTEIEAAMLVMFAVSDGQPSINSIRVFTEAGEDFHMPPSVRRQFEESPKFSEWLQGEAEDRDEYLAGQAADAKRKEQSNA